MGEVRICCCVDAFWKSHSCRRRRHPDTPGSSELPPPFTPYLRTGVTGRRRCTSCGATSDLQVARACCRHSAGVVHGQTEQSMSRHMRAV